MSGGGFLGIILALTLHANASAGESDATATIQARDIVELVQKRRELVLDPAPAFEPRALEAGRSDPSLTVPDRDRMDSY